MSAPAQAQERATEEEQTRLSGLLDRFEMSAFSDPEIEALIDLLIGFDWRRGDDPATGGHQDIPEQLAALVWQLPNARQELRL